MHCNAMHCFTLHWTALHSSAQHCTALHCTTSIGEGVFHLLGLEAEQVIVVLLPWNVQLILDYIPDPHPDTKSSRDNSTNRKSPPYCTSPKILNRTISILFFDLLDVLKTFFASQTA